jgi:hypothetical protein
MVFLVAFSVEHRQIVKGCLTLVTVRDDVMRLTLLTMYDWLGTPPAFATLFRQLSLSLCRCECARIISLRHNVLNVAIDHV